VQQVKRATVLAILKHKLIAAGNIVNIAGKSIGNFETEVVSCGQDM
jgi:hypothetical protein